MSHLLFSYVLNFTSLLITVFVFNMINDKFRDTCPTSGKPIFFFLEIAMKMFMGFFWSQDFKVCVYRNRLTLRNNWSEKCD